MVRKSESNRLERLEDTCAHLDLCHELLDEAEAQLENVVRRGLALKGREAAELWNLLQEAHAALEAGWKMVREERARGTVVRVVDLYPTHEKRRSTASVEAGGSA